MQAEWIAEYESERSMCRIHHGPLSECGDDERDWFPQRMICWPTAQLAAAKRMFDEVHKDRPWHDGTFTIHAEKFSPLTPFRYDDGHRFYLAEWDENPDDDFTTNPAAKPRGLVAQKSPDDQS